jgi:Family of unknown function (DUF5691)
MQIWQQLINTALLGTEKMPLQAENLPQAVQDYTQKKPADSPETAFLRAATLVMAYRTAGENPENYITPEYGIAPDAANNMVKTVCPDALLQYIKRERDAMEAVLFAMVLEKMSAKNWILPPAAVINALNIGTEKSLHTHLRTKIVEIVGERGRWLAQYNDEWAFVLKPENDYELWTEGSPEDRLRIFKKTRNDNPIQAVEMLVAAWSSLAAKERKTFLEAMRSNFGDYDEAFLEMVYEDTMKQKENEKGIKSEIKTLVVNLLIAIPNSKKQNWIFEQITPYFTTKKTLMGFGKTETILSLPTENDAFFCPDIMVKILGRSKSNTFLHTHSDAENWFCELVACLSPQSFSDFLGTSKTETMVLFQHSFHGRIRKNHFFAASAFGGAIALHEARELVFLYLKNQEKSGKDNPFIQNLPALFALLSDNEMDLLLQENFQNLSLSLLEETLPKQVWSSYTSAHFLKLCVDDISTNYYNNLTKQYLVRCLPYLSADALQNFNKALDRMTFKSGNEQQKVINTVHQPLEVFFAHKGVIAAQ